jgi:hypothetical protein
MKKVIGIDRKIKRAWLDATLDRLAGTTDADELRQFLDEQLQEELPGKESRKKSVGIILRIWSGVPADRVRFRDRAVALLPKLTGQDRLWLHWGMAALAYPFFRDAAEVVGRLLTLQDEVTTAQVQARLLPTWGDRATTKEAAQKFLHTLVDWEVLRTGKTKGRFLLGKKKTATSQALQLWLLEALLAASASDEIEAQQLLRMPEAFPFSLTVSVADLRRHEGFDVHREGLDMEKVALRKPPAEEPAKAAKKPRKAKRERAETQPGLFDRQPEEVAAVNGQQRSRDDAPYGAPIAECATLLRLRYYHGCIALALAVLESAVLLVWKVKVRRRKNQTMVFPEALDALQSNSVIDDDFRDEIERVWARRQDILRGGLSEESGSHLLEDVARSSLALLSDLQRQFFGYTQRDGAVIPDHPEYWVAWEEEKPLLAEDVVS